MRLWLLVLLHVLPRVAFDTGTSILRRFFYNVTDCWTSRHFVSDNFRGPSGEARSEFEIQVGQIPSTHWLETHLDCDTRLKSKILRQNCQVRSVLFTDLVLSRERVIGKTEFYCTNKYNSTTALRVELFGFHRRTQYAKSKFITNLLMSGLVDQNENIFVFDLACRKPEEPSFS